VAVAGDVAGVCANEVAMKNANKIVTNDLRVFIEAFCQQSVSRDKCETSYKNKKN